MENQPSTFDRVDNMLVQCGTFSGAIQIVCSVIFIIIFCGLGYYFFNKKDTKVKTQATVVHGECKTYSVKSGNSSRMQTDCVLDIEFKVGDKIIQQKLITNDKMHSKGEIIDIKYDPANPLDVEYNQIESKTLGMILGGIGSLFVICLIIHIVLMRVSDWYKRLMCVNMIGSAFRGATPGFGFGSSSYGNSGFGGIGPSFDTSFG
jgi:predicted permease